MKKDQVSPESGKPKKGKKEKKKERKDERTISRRKRWSTVSNDAEEFRRIKSD